MTTNTFCFGSLEAFILAQFGKIRSDLEKISILNFFYPRKTLEMWWSITEFNLNFSTRAQIIDIIQKQFIYFLRLRWTLKYCHTKINIDFFIHLSWFPLSIYILYILFRWEQVSEMDCFCKMSNDLLPYPNYPTIYRYIIWIYIK